ELAELSERSRGMKAKWQSEKEQITRRNELKQRIDDLRIEAERATRTGDLSRAAQIQYGEIPEAEREMEAADGRRESLQAESRFLKEEVDAEDIAEVVSRWTGIPVSRMLETERERLRRLETLLGARVIGQEPALRVVSDAVRRSRAGLQDPDRPIGS